MSTIFYMLPQRSGKTTCWRFSGTRQAGGLYPSGGLCWSNSVISTALTPADPGLFGSAHPARRLLGDFAVVHRTHPGMRRKGTTFFGMSDVNLLFIVAHIPQESWHTA